MSVCEKEESMRENEMVKEKERERESEREKKNYLIQGKYSFLPEVGLPDQDTAPERFG